MEDENAQMAAIQGDFQETIAKLDEDFTARLRVLQASNKSMWYSWYEGQRRDAAAEAAPLTGDTVFPDASVERAAGQLTLENSSAGTASSDAAAEAAPLTGDTISPDASVERVARKLTLKAESSREICGERGASTHPFDPGTVFPLEVHYHKESWLQHGSSSNSNSHSSNSSSSNSSNSNDTTSTYDSWWDVTCVGALLRPFDPGKRCRRSARIGRAALGLDLGFDRGKAWRRMQHGG